MPNKTIYIKETDARVWAEAQELANRNGVSLSELLVDGLRELLKGRRPATPVVRATTVQPLPSRPASNPFAAS